MANTLKFGNGEWYGKKDTILAYNDLNSNYKPLPFNFSRASKATVINKDGLIEEVGSGQPRVDYLNNTKGAMLLEPSRTNLITYSEDFPRTYWTKSGATIQGDPSTLGSELVTNGSFTGGSTGWALGSGWAYSSNAINATSTSSVCYQDIAATQSNITYTVTYQISNYSGGNIQWRFGGTGTVDGATRNANGTYTESFTNSSSGDKRLFLSPSGFTGTIDNVSVKEVQGFTSPDGTNNAYKLVEGTNNGSHTVRRLTGISVTSSQDYTFSFFAKKDERSIVGISNTIGGADKNAFIDVENGIILSSEFNDSSIDNYGNGWYKISLTHTATNTADYDVRIYTSIEDGNFSYQGNGTSGVYIYGAQIEAGSYSTSAIFTSGSAVTRLADSCNNGGNDQVINSTEGVLYFEGSALADGSVDKRIYIDDGTMNNYVAIGYSRFAGNIISEIISGGVLQTVNWGATGVNQTNNNKFALSWGSGTMKFYVNGTQTNTESVTSPTGLNVLEFNTSINTLFMEANVKDVRVYNTTLTDAELQALTQV